MRWERGTGRSNILWIKHWEAAALALLRRAVRAYLHRTVFVAPVSEKALRGNINELEEIYKLPDTDVSNTYSE